MLFINKPTANQQLNKAVELYQPVITRSSSPTLAPGHFRACQDLGSAGQAGDGGRVVYESDDRMAGHGLCPDVFAAFGGFEAGFDQGSLRQIRPVRAQAHIHPAAPGNADLDKIPEEGPVFTPGIKAGLEPEEKTSQQPENKGEANKPQEKTEKPADSAQPSGADKPADAQGEPTH